MTILAGDIKLLKSDTMSDVPEGGGAMTGGVIADGVSNNIFDDISTLDRVYGAVHMRKVFPAVQTQTTDKYFGSHVIISKLPGDAKIGVNLFNTGDYFDRRPAAASRVENYRAQGPNYNGFLWGTQYQGSRAIAIFQAESAPLPGIGDVLMIKTSTTSQYIRIVKLEDSLQTFTDGQGQFTRRILDIEISDVLLYDFVGSEINRLDTISPAAKLYKTVAANAARYYSARPLALAGADTDITVKVDSVYSQVVPSSQSEVALVDNNAGGNANAVLDAAGGTVSFDASADFAANTIIYLGSPCLPGSLSIPVTGGTLTDSGGNIKAGETTVGTINYAEGTLTFSASSPTYTGTKTVTFRPAGAPVRLADTASIAVTAANRGFVWTINIDPAPKPKSLKVMFRALNQWYELNDNGAGGILGTESGIGSGSVNYVTGSASVTLAAMPDADSEIIFSWGSNADYLNRSGFTPGALKVTKVLAQAGILPASLVIGWNDGSARSITCSAVGVLSGYGSGKFNVATSTVEFYPTTLPLGGTSFTFDYNYGSGGGAATVETFTDVALVGTDVILPLTNEPYPGSVAVELPLQFIRLVDHSGTFYANETAYLHDDGLGSFSGLPGVINYVGKSITLPNTYLSGRPSKTADYKSRLWGVKLMGYNLSTVASQYKPAGQAGGTIKVSYRQTADFTAAQETLTLANIQLDLTPGYAEDIVQGSVRFTLGGRTYIDRQGQLYYGIDPVTGAGTFAGTIDYSTGIATLSAWATGASNSSALQSLLTTQNFAPVDNAVFRVPVAPVKVGVFSVRAVPVDGGGEISATSDAQGDILTAHMDGKIVYENGLVNIRFGAWVVAAGNEGEWWYDALNVRADGKIFKPRHVYADTILFNAVSYSYLPLSAAILGLDPVRLPADGRIPVYATGDVVVVLHDQTTTGTFTSAGTTNLGRGRIAKLSVRDLAGQLLDVAKYSANLNTGIITWGDLTGVSQPLTIVDRIEDMAVLNDVQINGTLGLSQPLTHNFPVTETLVANAIIYGTLYARTSIPFDQQTWTNVWSDALIGSGVGAQYNATQYPIVVNNVSAIQERWALIFTSATTLNVVGEHVGQILTGVSIASAIAPINPNTNEPYFTIPAAGWGSGWSSGNVLRFNSYGANAPTWIIQAIAQGEATDTDYTFCLEVRGDIDTP